MWKSFVKDFQLISLNLEEIFMRRLIDKFFAFFGGEKDTKLSAKLMKIEKSFLKYKKTSFE